jgi:hypothetical protein
VEPDRNVLLYLDFILTEPERQDLRHLVEFCPSTPRPSSSSTSPAIPLPLLLAISNPRVSATLTFSLCMACNDDVTRI